MTKRNSLSVRLLHLQRGRRALLRVGGVPGLTGCVTITTGTYGNQAADPGARDTVGAMVPRIPGFGSRDLEDALP
jgi:hypothetical protein